MKGLLCMSPVDNTFAFVVEPSWLYNWLVYFLSLVLLITNDISNYFAYSRVTLVSDITLIYKRVIIYYKGQVKGLEQ